MIKAVQQKIDRLHRAKGFSCRPVLIRVNGVTDDLMESGYFSEVVDFSQLLDSTS